MNTTTENTTPAVLQFEDTQLILINHAGEVWVRGTDICAALGYANPRVSAYDLYTKHAGEFTAAMTTMLTVVDGNADQPPEDGDLRKRSSYAGADLRSQTSYAGQTREVRVFSPRGTHLMAMFARTPAAARFRHWVLDVLEGVAEARQPALTFGQEMAAIRLGVMLMERIQRCESLPLAEDLYARLLRVNRRLGMQTAAFFDLALAWRQRRLDMLGDESASDPRQASLSFADNGLNGLHAANVTDRNSKPN